MSDNSNETTRVQALPEPINFAILTARDTNQCKTLFINDKGMLDKESSANPTTGNFKQYQAGSMAELNAKLEKLTAKQSLVIGTPHRQDGKALQTGESINLTTKRNPRANAIPRTKEFIKYRNHAGLMLFDIDGGGTYEQLLSFIPELAGLATLKRPSSSSFIADSAGNELVGAKGLHIYVAVKNLKDVERIAGILWARQWLAKHGHYLLSGGVKPMLLERGIYDKAVLGMPERLAFEAKPLGKNGLMQADFTPHTRIIEGALLDTSIITDLTATELEEVEQLKNAAKEAIEPEHKKAIKQAKRDYIAKTGKTAKDALRDYQKFAKRELTPDFMLHTAKGERLVSSLTAKDDGLTMSDPFEPDYDGGNTTKAKFFWNDGKNPIINSQAHGGIVYKLAKPEPVTPRPKPSGEIEPAHGGGEWVKWEWWIELCAHVDHFNKNHAQVLLGGKHRIMRVVPANHSPDNRETLEFFSQKELALAYQNDRIKVGEKNTRYGVEDVIKDKITAWAEHKESRTFKGGVIFKPYPPNKEQKGNAHYFNTWRGFAVQPKENRELLALVKFHIEKIVCSGNPELIAYFYNWIAFTVQQPDKPAGAAIVLRGDKGCGKGTIGHFLRDIWGNHGTHISNAKHFVGNFNGHLADTCFLFADEAFYSGDKQHEGVLKALITEPTIMVERKGIDAIPQPNYLKVLMATNSDFAVPASRDERRYFVVDVADSHIGNRNYFNSLLADRLNKEVQAAFLFEMLNRGIENFHTGDIPETDALKEQRAHSLCSVGKWLVDCLSNAHFEYKDGQHRIMEAWDGAEKNFSVLWQSYLLWCDDQRTGEYNRTSKNAFGRYLSSAGFIRRDSNGATWRKMLTCENALRMFEDFQKITIKNG